MTGEHAVEVVTEYRSDLAEVGGRRLLSDARVRLAIDQTMVEDRVKLCVPADVAQVRAREHVVVVDLAGLHHILRKRHARVEIAGRPRECERDRRAV